MDTTGNVPDRKLIVAKDTVKTSTKFCGSARRRMIGLRSSVPGALHHRIVSVDMAKKPEDAKHIAVIDLVIDGL